jgi:hypothetical protein
LDLDCQEQERDDARNYNYLGHVVEILE